LNSAALHHTSIKHSGNAEAQPPPRKWWQLVGKVAWSFMIKGNGYHVVYYTTPKIKPGK
jgi:hypothetical protein